MHLHAIVFLILLIIHLSISFTLINRTRKYNKNPKCENSKQIILSDSENNMVKGLVIGDLVTIIVFLIFGLTASPLDNGILRNILRRDMFYTLTMILVLAAFIVNAVSASYLRNKVSKDDCGKDKTEINKYHSVQALVAACSFFIIVPAVVSGVGKYVSNESFV